MMDQQIADFLAAKENVPFAWGSTDCCISIADYVHAVTGADPASDLRGTYATEVQAQLVMAAEGGLRRIMARSGWARADAPQAGDIGLIRSRPILPAIFDGAGWWYKSGGLGFAMTTGVRYGPVWRRPA